MKPLVEDLIVTKNNFVKILNLSFAIISLIGIIFIKDDPWKGQWYAVAGVLFFGGIYMHYAKYKIQTDKDGFTIYSLLKPKFINWNEVSSVEYLVKKGKSIELILQITHGQKSEKLNLSVKQFKKIPMQRLFEMLNEQCDLATKNDFFLKQVEGDLKWTDKLNMLK